MNILDSYATRKCTSCGACGAVCFKGAISIGLNEEGFYRPLVDTENCIDCGLCVKVCYKFDEQLKLSTDEDLDRKKLYSAWSNDATLLKQTTSGGIGDLLARQLIEDGYKVVGVVYNEDKTRAEHRIASSLEETVAFRGSKYIQSYTLDALREVMPKVKNEKYAVFGTPCQIYALNRYSSLRNVRDNFVFVDLYCHGCPSIHVWTKYLQQMKGKYGVDRFDHVNFRSKIRGWGSFNVAFEKSGKTLFSNKATDDGFYELFFCDTILNEGCNDCKLRGTLEYTDLRLGDFWGKKFLGNRTGVSAVSVATEKGAALFEKIKGRIAYDECSYSECLPYQSWNLTYMPDEQLRHLLLESLMNEEESITNAVRILHQRQPLKQKLKRYVKNVLRPLPIGVTLFLKKHIIHD